MCLLKMDLGRRTEGVVGGAKKLHKNLSPASHVRKASSNLWAEEMKTVTIEALRKSISDEKGMGIFCPEGEPGNLLGPKLQLVEEEYNFELK